MALITPILNLGIVLDRVNKTITVTDRTVWEDFGLSPDVTTRAVAIQIYTPVGLLYFNPSFNTPSSNPDFTDGALTVVKTMPVDNKGNIINGEYLIKAKLTLDDLPAPHTYDFEFKQVIDYDHKCIKLSLVEDCMCAKFTSRDITDYGTSTKITYDHAIYYPQVANTDAIHTLALNYVDNRLHNGVYQVEIITQRSWAFGANYSVLDTLRGSDKREVDCTDVCGIKCAFSKLLAEWEANVAVDQVKADALWKQINKATVLQTMIAMSQRCGNVDDSSLYIKSLKLVLGSCDCEDCADQTGWVTGACGSNSGGNGGEGLNYIFSTCNNLLEIGDPINNGTTVEIPLCIKQDAITSLVQHVFQQQVTQIIQQTFTTYGAFYNVNTACFGLVPPEIGGGVVTSTQKMQFIVNFVCSILGLDFTCLTDANNIVDKFNALIQKVCAINASIAAFAVDDRATVIQGSEVSIPVLANDNIMNYPISLEIEVSPLNGTVEIMPDQTIKYAATDGSFVGNDSFVYRVTDSAGTIISATVVVTVVAITSGCPAYTANFLANVYNSGRQVTVTVHNVSDINGGCPDFVRFDLTFRDFNGNIVATASTGNLGAGAPFNNPTGVVVPYTSNMYTVDILETVSTVQCDANERCTAQTKLITGYTIPQINNTAPVANYDGYTTPQNTTLVVNDPALGLLANDTDIDNDTLSITAEVKPTDGGGSVEIHANGTFVLTPLTGFQGTDTFQYELSDGINAPTIGTCYVDVLVPLAATAPVTANFGVTIPSTENAVVIPFSLHIDSNGYTYVLKITTLPTKGVLTNYGKNGDKIWTKTGSPTGTDTIGYTATSNELTSDPEAIVTITIE